MRRQRGGVLDVVPEPVADEPPIVEELEAPVVDDRFPAVERVLAAPLVDAPGVDIVVPVAPTEVPGFDIVDIAPVPVDLPGVAVTVELPMPEVAAPGAVAPVVAPAPAPIVPVVPDALPVAPVAPDAPPIVPVAPDALPVPPAPAVWAIAEVPTSAASIIVGRMIRMLLSMIVGGQNVAFGAKGP